MLAQLLRIVRRVRLGYVLAAFTAALGLALLIAGGARRHDPDTIAGPTQGPRSCVARTVSLDRRATATVERTASVTVPVVATVTESATATGRRGLARASATATSRIGLTRVARVASPVVVTVRASGRATACARARSPLAAQRAAS